jgi:hypothetical protein
MIEHTNVLILGIYFSEHSEDAGFELELQLSEPNDLPMSQHHCERCLEFCLRLVPGFLVERLLALLPCASISVGLINVQSLSYCR